MALGLDVILIPLLQVFIIVLKMYRLIIFVYIIMGWLLAFNALNPNSPAVYSVQSLLSQLIEPVLSPLRRIVPPLGMLDLSALVLVFIINFLISVFGMMILKAMP